MPWLPEQRMPMTDEVRNELIVNCIVVSITLVVVTLRVVGRIYGPGFGWDDALVVHATVGPSTLFQDAPFAFCRFQDSHLRCGVG